MLATLDPGTLDRVWFPLGEQTKDETRAQAAAQASRSRARADSQEACFLGGDDYRAFLARQGLERRPAPSSTRRARLGTMTASGASRPVSARASASRPPSPSMRSRPRSRRTPSSSARAHLSPAAASRFAAGSTATRAGSRRSSGYRSPAVAASVAPLGRRLRDPPRRARLRRRTRSDRGPVRRRRRGGRRDDRRRSRKISRRDRCLRVRLGRLRPLARLPDPDRPRARLLRSSSWPPSSSARRTSLIRSSEREIMPVIEKTGGTVDRVNRELDKIDPATDSAVDAVVAVDEAVRAVSFAVKRRSRSSSASPRARSTASQRCARSGTQGGCRQRERGRCPPRGRLRRGSCARLTADASTPSPPHPTTTARLSLPASRGLTLSHAHDCGAARRLPALLRGARAPARALALADPARGRSLDAVRRRGHAAVQAVLPRPARAAGASASSASRRCCAPAARTPTSRTSAAPTGTARSSRCSATSRSATTSRTSAVELAWEFVTQHMGLDPRPLWATVYEGDAALGWTRTVAIEALAARRRAGRADRPRSARTTSGRPGRPGPCGPCSELFFDRGAGARLRPPPTAAPGCDCDRYLEFWNLVFMQYDRDAEAAADAAAEAEHRHRRRASSASPRCCRTCTRSTRPTASAPIIARGRGLVGRALRRRRRRDRRRPARARRPRPRDDVPGRRRRHARRTRAAATSCAASSAAPSRTATASG